MVKISGAFYQQIRRYLVNGYCGYHKVNRLDLTYVANRESGAMMILDWVSEDKLVWGTAVAYLVAPLFTRYTHPLLSMDYLYQLSERIV
jgi:hypothetical protein